MQPELERFFCRVEYRGTQYDGWQIQPHAPSVQGHLEKAFTTIARIPCPVTGAGRTDAGVHAKAQGMHVDLPQNADPFHYVKSVNAILPDDMCIYAMQKIIKPGFHARFTAFKRGYQYTFALRKSPLIREYAWWLRKEPNWQAMQEQIPALLGEHDFSAFCASGTTTTNMRSTVSHVSLTPTGDRVLFCIEANRFVYKMVRSLVGTLMAIGFGKQQQPLEEIIAAGKRTAAGVTAPALGLVLTRVEYPAEFAIPSSPNATVS